MSVCSSTLSGPEDMDELESVSWYHYDLSRHAAEALLMSNGIDGSFLLRNSNKGPERFALSVRAKDSVKHFHVQRHNGRYSFGFNEFSCLQDFTSHLANQPLLGSETGSLIVLRFPYPRQVEEPSIYESVCVHTAIQTGRSESDLVPSAPSLGTKEGYLVKQGGIVKNWKQRWFTLNRNELKYFKDKMFPEPIRTLDLTECSAVQFDYSQERVNCFCLVFPERTFYLCAKSGVEADEWIKILRWKLGFTCRNCISCYNGYSCKKVKELSIGESQANLKLRRKGKLIRTIVQGENKAKSYSTFRGHFILQC